MKRPDDDMPVGCVIGCVFLLLCGAGLLVGIVFCVFAFGFRLLS